MCKKRKLNNAIENYTTPSPSKAIQPRKNSFSKIENSELKIRNNLETKNSAMLKKSYDSKNVSNTTNTKEHLGVTALVAVIEPATESPSSRSYKQPLRSRTSKKSKSSWTQGQMETCISYQKENPSLFPT